jgi:DNA-binding response OmpR family regulator
MSRHSLSDKIRILVVDDEPRYVWAIQKNLEARGYRVFTASDGERALDLVRKEHPDLILLDVRMPGLDGFEVCHRLRSFSQVPVIFLTALAEETDKVKGLDIGADDYVTKPFGVEELLARVRAALRRLEVAGGSESPPVLEIGALRVDPAQRRVFVYDREIDLTPTEYRLLLVLAEHAGRTLVSDFLLERVWGPGCAEDSHLLRQVVHRLRQKIEPDPRNPQYIITRRGIGYVLESFDA